MSKTNNTFLARCWGKKFFGILLGLTLLAGCAQEPEERRWVGADYFPMPLHDWSREGDTLIARPASFGGRWGIYQARLYYATATIAQEGNFETQFSLRRTAKPTRRARRMGLWLGLKSQTPSPLNVWIHPKNNPLFIGISSTGTLQIGNKEFGHRLDPDYGVRFTVKGVVGASGDELSVTASVGANSSVTAQAKFPAGTLIGSLSLVAQGKSTAIRFDDWTVTGDAVVKHPERTIGPILWTQYTLQDSGSLKLQAQMVPLEATDAQQAELQFLREGVWETVAEATLEPASSTFVFAVKELRGETRTPYRVAYNIEGQAHYWEGAIRANPRDEEEFTLGVFNCDHGELFPQDTMVRNVTLQDPDMLFFAGDQIYEEMDKVLVVREPPEGARLSYLGKFYQFGLTWRHLLKDRPSVIIPDDHDVFMPNVWGYAGLGYSMPAEWVNMVQRTQTGNLPDPIDPEPVKRGINVYFTDLDYAAMSFAVVEDRKFKSPTSAARGTKRDPKHTAKLDRPQARLLGARQLRFVRQWRKRTDELPVRWFLSQSMFSKGTTHNDSPLKRLVIDMDTNGWPQTARKRALRSIGRNTIMVNGDQHIGMLARMGIDTWDDGPLSFMVTGSSVGHPRAWWPETKPHDGELNGPYTGRYLDDFTNHITVLGVTNPHPLPDGVTNAWLRPDVSAQGPFAVQAAKGSGYGLVTVNKKSQTAKFEAFRLDFDASSPLPDDQFPGFPITQSLR